MFLSHVGIHAPAAIIVTESPHTSPADMSFARSASYMVASSILLYVGLTFWACPDAIVLLPTREKLGVRAETVLVLIARDAFMMLDMALGANANET
jgi:hypothetical protein